MSVKAANGTIITDEKLDAWCEAFDKDQWPEGWENKSEVVYGRPPLSAGGSATLSIKVPVAMKEKIAQEAAARGTTISNYARTLLAEGLLAG